MIKLGGGCEEEDGGDAVEALEPLLSLRPLAPDVDEKEGDICGQKKADKTSRQDGVKMMSVGTAGNIRCNYFMFVVYDVIDTDF